MPNIRLLNNNADGEGCCEDDDVYNANVRDATRTFELVDDEGRRFLLVDFSGASGGDVRGLARVMAGFAWAAMTGR